MLSPPDDAALGLGALFTMDCLPPSVCLLLSICGGKEGFADIGVEVGLDLVGMFVVDIVVGSSSYM